MLITILPLSGCYQSDEGIHSDKLELDLSIDQVNLKQGKVTLESTLINGLDTTISFLPWGTPLDDVSGGRSVVIKNSETGKELIYQGIMVKRRAATERDYIALKAHDKMTSVQDLSRSYSFCSNSRYILEFNGKFTSLNNVALLVEASSIEFETSGAFKNCSSN